jgi:hypothetical protein
MLRWWIVIHHEHTFTARSGRQSAPLLLQADDSPRTGDGLSSVASTPFCSKRTTVRVSQRRIVIRREQVIAQNAASTILS